MGLRQLTWPGSATLLGLHHAGGRDQYEHALLRRGELARILAQGGGDVRGRRVLLLGVSFKRNVGDIRNSSALKILELLEARGLDVSYHDPFVPRLRLGTRELESVPLGRDVVSAADCVVIHTDHESVDYVWLVAHARLVFDTRNATRDVRVDRTGVVRL